MEHICYTRPEFPESLGLSGGAETTLHPQVILNPRMAADSTPDERPNKIYQGPLLERDRKISKMYPRLNAPPTTTFYRR